LLIQKLIEQTRQILNQLEKLKTYDSNVLTSRESPKSWNILECLEHLNLYGEFYLPEIESKIKISKTKSEVEFRSGFIGNYFNKMILPKEKSSRMKAFKSKNPLNKQLDKTVIDKLIDQQMLFLNLLNQSRNVSLNKVKIKTSFSSLIQLKLGDIFQFLINHTLRHLKQVEKIQEVSKNL